MKELIRSQWTITLVATMLGVFAGIYLNDYFNRHKQEKDLQGALIKVRSELEQNRRYLSRTHDTLDFLHAPLQYFFSKVNVDGELIMAPQEMSKFTAKYPTVFIPTDSVRTAEGKYRYHGDMGVQIPAILSIQLSSVAWDACKDSDLGSIADFECLYNLETVYKLQSRVMDEFDKLLDSFSAFDNPSAWGPMLKVWKYNLDYQGAYLQATESIDKIFSECH